MKSYRLFFIALIATNLLMSNYAVTQSIVLFSPYDKPTDHLLQLIDSAKSSIDAAIYMITDKEIAFALIDAHDRGVAVRVATDPISLGKYGKADLLAENGVPVFVLDPRAKPTQNRDSSRKAAVAQFLTEKRKHPKINSQISFSKKENPIHTPRQTSKKSPGDERFFSNDPIMHHKFMIIDGIYLWTGSFNWTNAANTKNHENVLLSNDKFNCTTYKNHFNRIITDGSCKRYYPGRSNMYTSGSLAGKVLSAINEIPQEALLADELKKILEDHQLVSN